MICYSKDGIGRYIGKTEQPLYTPPPAPPEPVRTVHAGRSGDAVLCVETGIQYPSAAAAARGLPVPESTHYDARKIRRACRSGRQVLGHHWRYVASA